MRGYLKRDCMLSPLCSGESVDLPKGWCIPIIRLDYLPYHIKEKLSKWDLEEFKDEGKYVITYLWRRWFKIKSEDVGYLYYNDWYNN